MSKNNLFSSLKTTSSKLVLLICVIISSLGYFVSSATSIALPSIQSELGASIGQIQWVLNSYTLMLGIFVLLSGSLSDRISRKKTLSLGLLVFAFSSFLLGFTKDINIFIFLRFIQGFGAALIIPQSLALINTNYEKQVRGRVIGFWEGFSGILTIFSPILGGLLVDFLGWNAVFYINVPFALISLILVQIIVRDIKHPKLKHKFDLRGAFLLITFLGLLSYGLITGSENGFSQTVTVSLFLSLINLIGLIYIELRADEPIFVLRVLKMPHIIGASIFTAVFYGIIGALFVFVYMLLQQIIGFSATKSGLILLPVALIMAFLGFFTGRIADKYGNRWPTVAGGVLAVFSLLFIRYFENIPYEYNLLVGLVLLGSGFGLFIPSLTKAALDVSEQYSGFASGFNNAIAWFTPLVFTAIFSFIILNSFQSNLLSTMNNMNVDENVKQEVMQDSEKLLAMKIPPELDNDEFKQSFNQGFIDGYNQLALFAAMSCFSATILAFVLIKK